MTTILERLLTAVLIPALLTVTVPQLGPVPSDRANSPSTTANNGEAALGAVLFGTTTEENDLYSITLDAPDNVGTGESFTATATLEAKTDLQFAAFSLQLPEGMSTTNPQLSKFQQSMSSGDTLTGEFELQASQSGTYDLTVDARAKPADADSQSLSATVSVAVGQGQNGGQPTAQFNFSPQQPESGTEVTFDASASSTPQGEIASYQWDFGDGTTTEESQPTVTHTYQQAGDYTVALTVTDSQGNTASAQQSITVLQGNERPQATFSVDVEQPQAGQAITFDGTGSSDPDGQIQNYRWTLGDGTVMEGANQATITHTYQEPGTYQVTLVVTDNEGATSQPRTVSLNVERAPTLFERVPTAVWIGAGVAAAAGAVYVLATQVMGGGASDDGGQPASQNVQSQLKSRAQSFISENDLPFKGVTQVSRQTRVPELERVKWVRQLLDRALIIHTKDGFSIKQYGQMSESEQSEFDARADKLNAGSLLGFVSNRVSSGDTIYQLTWERSNGETVQSWAVVGSDGQLKLDTLISFYPLDP
ncbi:MAG: PKD domain-containing protein [Candidatus Bipolaricaulia bacterium]